MKSPLRFAVLFLALVGSAQSCKAGYIYSGDSTGDLWRTDSGTGASTWIGDMGPTQFDIAFNPLGQLFGVTGGSALYSVNAGTAASAFIGNLGVVVNGLDFRSDGVLFGSGGSTLYKINTGTGAATSVGGIGFASAGDLAFASDGSLFMTATGGAGGTSRLIKVNPLTGAGTLVGGIGFVNVYGIDFIGSTLFGTTEDGRLLTINTATGAGTQIALTGVDSYGSSVNPSAVPEPTSLALCALAALGTTLGAARRRRQDQVAA